MSRHVAQVGASQLEAEAGGRVSDAVHLPLAQDCAQLRVGAPGRAPDTSRSPFGCRLAAARAGNRGVVSAIFGSEDTETETDSLVDDLFKERVASATSTGSADESLAARIAAGEFSSTSPLVEFFKPLRKALAQVPGPGAWATQGGSRSGERDSTHTSQRPFRVARPASHLSPSRTHRGRTIPKLGTPSWPHARGCGRRARLVGE